MPRDRSTHQFGGDWTDRKLEVLAKYLQRYTTALKNTPLHKIYIDAFAGTGYREPQRTEVQGPATCFSLTWLKTNPSPCSMALLAGHSRLILLSTDTSSSNEAQSGVRCSKPEGRVSTCSLRSGHPTGGRQHQDPRSVRPGLAVETSCPVPRPVRHAGRVEDDRAIARPRRSICGCCFRWHWSQPIAYEVRGDSGVVADRLNLLLGTEDWYDEFYKVEAHAHPVWRMMRTHGRRQRSIR